MKLEFRVPYNTDVEKIRKIVKKINPKIEEDEEMGPKLLAPIKSQGVKELSSSAGAAAITAFLADEENKEQKNRQ